MGLLLWECYCCQATALCRILDKLQTSKSITIDDHRKKHICLHSTFFFAPFSAHFDILKEWWEHSIQYCTCIRYNSMLTSDRHTSIYIKNYITSLDCLRQSVRNEKKQEKTTNIEQLNKTLEYLYKKLKFQLIRIQECTVILTWSCNER